MIRTNFDNGIKTIEIIGPSTHGTSPAPVAKGKQRHFLQKNCYLIRIYNNQSLQLLTQNYAPSWRHCVSSFHRLTTSNGSILLFLGLLDCGCFIFTIIIACITSSWLFWPYCIICWWILVQIPYHRNTRVHHGENSSHVYWAVRMNSRKKIIPIFSQIPNLTQL